MLVSERSAAYEWGFAILGIEANLAMLRKIADEIEDVGHCSTGAIVSRHVRDGSLRAVAALEEAGLVDTDLSPTSSRSTWHVLTALGRELLAEFEAAGEEASAAQ